MKNFFNLMTSGANTLEPFDDLWSQNLKSYLIEKRQGALRELPNTFFEFSLGTYHTFGDNSGVCKKSLFSQYLTFGDLWRPQY